MTEELVFDCSFGAGANMLIAALLSLATNPEEEFQQVSSVLNKDLIEQEGYELIFEKRTEQGMSAYYFDCQDQMRHHGSDTAAQHEHHHAHAHSSDASPHHEHQHLHHSEHSHDHVHEHANATTHEHSHHEHAPVNIHEHTSVTTHEHSHSSGDSVHHDCHHEHHHYIRPARGPQELHDLIDNSNYGALTPLPHQTAEEQRAAITALAHKIVDLIAQAEASAHGVSPLEVHFHELGAIDCYVDIMLFATLITRLNPANVHVLSLAEGTGTHRCAHGEMSLPGMAVTQLLAASELELTIIPYQGEHLTPTAVACLVAATATPLHGKLGKITATGVSCGSRRFAHPNLARVYRTQQQERSDSTPSPSPAFELRQLTLVESNIDDSTPQMIAHAIGELFALGVRDAWSEPITMKKGRLAVKLCALIDPERLDDVLACFVTQTTAIGVRTTQVDRYELARKMVSCTINGAEYQAKMVVLPAEAGRCSPDDAQGSARRIYPEHDEVVRLSQNAGISYPEALSRMEAALREL